jgi:hypothetical protein
MSCGFDQIGTATPEDVGALLALGLSAPLATKKQ